MLKLYHGSSLGAVASSFSNNIKISSPKFLALRQAVSRRYACPQTREPAQILFEQNRMKRNPTGLW